MNPTGIRPKTAPRSLSARKPVALRPSLSPPSSLLTVGVPRVREIARMLAGQQPVVDSARVERFRRAIAEGQYSIDPDATARIIIVHMQSISHDA